MADSPGFPTQGELIRFAYRVAGVLPEKHDPILPRGSTRTGIRKAVARLAQEEGKLEENFEILLRQLSELVASYAAWPPVHVLIGDVLNDFIADYRDLLIDEGTFLDRQATLRWLIRDRWVPLGVNLLARSAAKWKPSMLLPLRPAAEDWFLPDFTAQGTVWPMRKALQWLYDHVGLSQTQFHYPGRDASEEDIERQRQLENAQNWMSGRSLPSAAALHASLHSAVKGRAEPIGSLSDDRALLGVEAVLFLARISTAIWQAVVDEYGEAFAIEMRTLFGRLWGLFVAELGYMERDLVAVSRETGISRADALLRSEVLNHWSWEMALRLKIVREKLNDITGAGGSLTGELYSQLVCDFGEAPVETLIIPLRSNRPHGVPAGFLDVYSNWMRLRSSDDATAADIHSFEELLNTNRLTDALCWMPPWLRFQQAYRREDYPAAWKAISQAYESAKYRAGRAQYEIVNQYVEMAAKCGTTQDFRRGVTWARYIGLPIRWIRDRPLSANNLAFAKVILQRATYNV